MHAHRREIAIEVSVVLLILAALCLLLIPEPRVARNSGNIERLSEILREISVPLIEEEARPSLAECFIRRGERAELQNNLEEGRQLFERFGVTQQWYGDGEWGEASHYPLAVADSVEFAPNSEVEPRIQVLMVPIRDSDIATLPNLYECADLNPEDAMAGQLKQMGERIGMFNAEYTAALFSDGSIWYVSDEDLSRVGIDVKRPGAGNE